MPLPSPPSFGDSGSTLKSPVWKSLLSACGHYRNCPPSSLDPDEKVAERPGTSLELRPSGTNSGSWWAFSWTFRVSGTGFGWDHQREFLSWAALGAKAPRGIGVFIRSNFIHKNISFIDYAVHGLDKSRVKSCPVQLGSCSQSLM